MNRLMTQEFSASLNLLQPAKGCARKIGLHTWLRDTITVATARSVYGLMNPYNDTVIADAFW